MATKKKPKATRVGSSGEEQLQIEGRAAARENEIVAVLKTLDFELWYADRTPAEQRAIVAMRCGFQLDREEFNKLREEHCKWMGRKRVKNSAERCLGWREWEKLRIAVRHCHEAGHLAGKTIEEAAAVVSQRFPCNATLLDGLDSRYRFWG
jgi:N-acyl-D-aspartate/D-glutamate deacylase